MKVNDRYCSFYYENDHDYGKIELDPAKTALLIIDAEYACVKPPALEGLTQEELDNVKRWGWFYETYDKVVVPHIQQLIAFCRRNKIEVSYAKIMGMKKDGRDRSIDQKMSGFNQFLVTEGDHRGEIIDEIKPEEDDIVVKKTTDSALIGTNLRLTYYNMGIDTVIVTGNMTDQCVSSTVRDLADESFKVWVPEDACLAATKRLHETELEIINNIYCHVVTTQELIDAVEKV
jgi:nicotinamidase-related amidase